MPKRFSMSCLWRRGGTLIFYTCKNFEHDYAFAHSLSVCLIAIRIGLRLQFDRQRLKNLGLLSLFHSPEAIKFSKEILNTFQPDQQLNQIVRLVDVYDALTHPPAYRHPTTPFDTLAAMIKNHEFFGRDLLKVLLEEISLYPRGSWVELSTKEIGRVIEVNENLPLRPTVKIFIDWQGKYFVQPKTIDLAKDNLVYVLRPLTEGEIKKIIEV